MTHAVSLGLVLLGTWLLMSGIYDHPLLLVLAVASVAAVVALTMRMDVVDHEGHPVHLGRRAVLYWPWLFVEILKANLDVVRRVLSPRRAISPTLVRLRTSQRSDLGRVIYANSITLTPGTVSVSVEPDAILVHALSLDGAEALETGEMDRRVSAMEGDSLP